MELTDVKIRKSKPREKGYEVKGGRGLFLRVLPSGEKSWCIRYVFEGVSKRLAIGRYPDMTLAEARERNIEARKDIRQGIDPATKKREEEAARRASPTFGDLWQEFQDKELRDRPATAARKSMIKKNVLPAWNDRKISSITRRDAVLLLDEVRERAPVMSNRLLGLLTRMFSFAVERGTADTNPLIGMRRAPERARSRVLDDAEIKTFWFALDKPEVNLYIPTKLALKSVLLTAARPGEVSAMRWSEIDGDAWVIPKERSKNGEECRRPILPMFKAILDEVAVYSGDSPFVFKSSYMENRPINTSALAKGLLRYRTEIGITGEPYTPHDLRRSARTKFAELGIDDVTSEKLLGHKLSGVLGIYNRYGYDAEKQKALGLWEQRLQVILGLSAPASNVIRMTEVRHVQEK